MLVRRLINPADAPKLSPEQEARMDAMTEDEIEAGALSDPDNPPPTEAEALRFLALGLIRRATGRSELSVAELAAALRLDPAGLEAVAAGDVTPDPALMSLLEVFVREPEAVTRSLAA